MIWRRRKSLVSLRQQLSFAFELVAVSIGFVILCAFLLFLPPLSDWVGDPIQAERLLDDMMRFVLLKWPLVIAAMAILTIIGVLMSHRMAGPIYGLERVIEAWRSGDRKARVRFRKYDYLLPAKDFLNAFFDAQEAQAGETARLAGEIRQALDRGDAAGAKARAEELTALLGKKGTGS